MACEPACERCAALRAATLKIVGADGAEGLSAARLAAAGGLTEAELSEHYATAADCLYETYEWVCVEVLLDLADAFAKAEDWQSGFELGRRRLLERMAERPDEARICFIEPLRGNRELQRRRILTRSWMVDFLAAEYSKLSGGEQLSVTQLEMLVGSASDSIANTVAAGQADMLPTLEGHLADVQDCFMPEDRRV